MWDGRRYTFDTMEEVSRRATDTVRKIHLEAAREDDGERRAEIAKHALRSESAGRIRDLLRRAESLLAVRPDQFDTDHRRLVAWVG